MSTSVIYLREIMPLPGNISFTVTALDPNFRITAVSDSAVAEALPTGAGTVLITDTAFDLGTVSVLGSGSIFTTGLPINGTLPIINYSSAFPSGPIVTFRAHCPVDWSSCRGTRLSGT